MELAAITTSTTTPSPGPTVPDPNSVTPGVGGFVVVFALAIVTWLLMRNMTGRLRRMRMREEQAYRDANEPPPTEADTTSG